MKQATTFLITILILVSCAKEQRRSTQVWMVNAINHDTALGVRSTIEVKSLGGGVQKSVWVAAKFDNGYWIQVGYRSPGIHPVAMCFKYGNISSIGFPQGTISLAPYPVLTAGTMGVFAIYLRNGNAIISMNGTEIISAPIAANYVATKHVSTETSDAPKAPHFPSVRLYPALEQLTSHGWQWCSSAFSSGSGWGVAGKNQIQTLQNNEVIMGSSVKSAPGQILW